MSIHPLRAYRDKKRISQTALGEKLGVTGQTIWRWEHRKRAPRRKDLSRIARLTNIPLEKLAAAGAAA